MKQYRATVFNTNGHEQKDNKPRPYDKGALVYFQNPPPKGSHFECLDDVEVDFEHDSQATLEELEWDPKDLKKFMKEKYDINVKLPASTRTLVQKLIYARDNHTNIFAPVVMAS